MHLTFVREYDLFLILLCIMLPLEASLFFTASSLSFSSLRGMYGKRPSDFKMLLMVLLQALLGLTSGSLAISAAVKGLSVRAASTMTSAPSSSYRGLRLQFSRLSASSSFLNF